MVMERNLNAGPVDSSFDTEEAGALAHRLREWVSPITKASWALDSALHNLRVARIKGNVNEIRDALMAAIIARQAAAQMWAKVEPELVKAANAMPMPEIVDRSRGWHVIRDGADWCATGPGFENLEESYAGFGPTPEAAIEALREKMGGIAGLSPLQTFVIHR